MQQFRYTSYAQEIIFGPDALAQVGQAIDRNHWQRLLLCSTGSLRRGGQIAALEQALGARLVASYERVQPHVPEAQVAEAMALAETYQIDAVIGFGGGSAIGLAKAVSLALEEKRGGQQAGAVSPIQQPLVPVIAIPTTYAGSEMTPVYGVTRQVDGEPRKLTVTDVRVTPRLTIYDPLLTLQLSPEMTASTGINALAHCVEALYSITRNPLSTAAALQGIHSIVAALPRCYAAGEDIEARTEMLNGSLLAAMALAHVTMAIHHGICHVLGGTLGVPHGVANSIILPHAMRFNLDATAPELAQAAEAMGIATAGQSAEAAAQEAIEAVDRLISQMNLPRRLCDAGVQEADLPRLAQIAFQSRTVQSNPKPVRDAAQVEAILRAAW
ncbi:MAG TPA: iron-containing alcohol dehydrogenase [Ktedonobacterales bacterium]|jgi:alcohol dehydrogenase class IV